ncbi:MAG: Spy/CpxP family protein refolding chaperone [bacterium]|nr:Spy/CpxP family protein refolding chaperone [bacterium]
MKKLAILLSLVVLTTACSYAADTKTTPKKQRPVITQEQMQKMKAEREAAFEQKLNLTDEQKAKAKEFRTQAHEKLAPIMKQIKENRQEAFAIKKARGDVKTQEEKLTKLDNEFKELQKEMHKIRQQNMKDFESILTADQKKILKNMKKEGRNRYRKAHPPIKRPVQQTK